MSFIRNSKVMTKLLVAAAITCAIVVAVGVMGMSEVSTMKSIADEMYEHELLGVQAAQSVDISLLKYVAQVERAVAHPELASEVRRGAAKLKEEAQHALDQLAESDKGHTVTEAERTVRSEVPLLFASADQVLHGLETKDQDLVNTSEAAMLEHEARLDAAVHTMVAARVERAHAEDLQAARVFEESKTYMLGFIGIALLLGLGLAFGIARSISRPLGETVAVLERIAEGDLTVSLADDRKDEVGQMARALNAAVQSMRTAMAEVRASATSVASTANQLTAAAEDISSGAQEQASGLEEAAASLEEMAEAIRQNAAGAERASDVSAESKTVATRGGEVVSQAVEAMEGVDAASHQISQIIGTIDEIAFQTNLLALNAAVEAARAGDQGRGFAVVASEVRNLAQRSASSAKEIKSLIEDSVRRVEAGSRLVSESGKSLTEIVGSVGRVSDLVQEIASASKEQSIGVGHVNAAVTQADRVTQSNAAQTEELSGSAETLAANSQQLLALANRFRLGDEEETAAAAPMLRLTRHADVQRPTAPHGTTSMPLAPTGTDGFEEF